MLRDRNGLVLVLFSKYADVMDSKEMEVLAILEALQILYGHFVSKLIIKSNPMNAAA